MAIEGRNIDTALEAEIKKFESAYRRDPSSRAFAALADAYRRAGLLEESIRIAEDGLKFHPRYLSGVVVLGRAYLAAGRPEDARAQLERVVEIDPDNLAAQRTLGDIYFDKKDWDKARRAYNEILRVQPDNQATIQRIEEIYQAERGVVYDESQPRDAAQGTADEPEVRKGERPGPEGPPGANAPLSEEEKMDIFFAGVDLARPVEESRRTDFQVKPVHQIFASGDNRTPGQQQSQQETMSPAKPLLQEATPATGAQKGRAKSPITTITMAELYMKQGYKDKALLVYEEIYQADPSRKDIAEKIIALRSEMGIEDDIKPVEAPDRKPSQIREWARPADEPEEETDRISPQLDPDVVRPSRALKEWWEGSPRGMPMKKWEQMTEEEKSAERLRSYLEIIRREEKK
jgi:tetratricopeptide (TPR) repeat protein